MSEFHVAEKRVPIMGSQLLAKLAELGVEVSGGRGKIHVHLFIPDNKLDEARDLLEAAGFEFVEESVHH